MARSELADQARDEGAVAGVGRVASTAAGGEGRPESLPVTQPSGTCRASRQSVVPVVGAVGADPGVGPTSVSRSATTGRRPPSPGSTRAAG